MIVPYASSSKFPKSKRIENKIMPPAPIDKDLYEMEPEEKAKVAQTPGSLQETLEALKNDHEFLLKGDVFTQDLIDTYIEYKMTNEVKPMALRRACIPFLSPRISAPFLCS